MLGRGSIGARGSSAWARIQLSASSSVWRRAHARTRRSARGGSDPLRTPSLRRLALADATEETIRRLINYGEDLLVERKRELPDAVRFGATVASFANTIGGWIPLGVEDVGTIAGYPTEPTLDVQSHLGHLLRNEVEPVPPFAAAVRQIDGAPVTIVRVFESEDSPVLVRRTAGVYHNCKEPTLVVVRNAKSACFGSPSAVQVHVTSRATPATGLHMGTGGFEPPTSRV